MEAWLPRLSLALLPLELLLLQLVLAGGNPGPAPRLEMVLLWALAVLLPQLRPPWVLPLALVRPVLAVLQLPLLLWLDGRAGLATAVSPGLSRAGWRACCGPCCCYWRCNGNCAQLSERSRLRSHQSRAPLINRASP